LVQKLSLTIYTRSNLVVLVSMLESLVILNQQKMEKWEQEPTFHHNLLIRLKEIMFQMNIFLRLKKHSMNALKRDQRQAIQSSV
jgi:hypothetical protein